MTALPYIVGRIDKNSREHVRIALDEFKGASFIDMRVFFDAGNGETKPTPKGITIRPEHIGRAIALLQEAELAARQRGWIE